MCDYSNQAESRKEALADMIKISKEAGLYETEPTLDEVNAAIKRVRKLHSPVPDPYQKNLQLCSYCGDEAQGSWTYPCSTIQALDGEQE